MNYIEKIRETREERARLAETARELLVTAQGESRAMTSEEDAKFSAIHADIEAKGNEARRLEQQAELDKELDTLSERRAETAVAETSQGKAVDFNDALKRWGYEGPAALSTEERAALNLGQDRRGTVIEINLRELRAQSVGTDSEGGYTIPEGFGSLQRALLAYGGARQPARILTTATGNKIPIPTVNDTGNEGALIGENTEVDELDVAFSKVDLDAYKYTSKAIRVPHELMIDSAFDMAGLLGELLGERLGRITNRHFTLGTGSSQPQGVVVGATDFGTKVAAVAAVTFAEVVGFKHGIDPAYRMSPSFGFMFNDSTLSALKQVSIGTGDARPVWQPGVAVGAPDTIDGSPYWINQNMASMGADNFFMLCGDFSNFWVRDVENIRLLRLDERYAEFDQTAFVGFSRHDSAVINAGTNPIKKLQNAAS